ncbi:uncharacterized protein BDZ83DRAFT_746429 [Colletotrichum acutatum]|uniref:Uncharacterized protein n=1 Tax=Glomerella acutata TaxID=27357 RepID=A0AAD9D3G6_GLOAC|nr:uncharacterized protein BDZ83DRAFT_746429 [Colletotrichum acutatum]KAK1731486.1 hypothetical protein BDZ83DRAFT_746429 [Colletotrichum acutatum]
MAYMQELQAVRSSRIGTETLGAVGQIYTYLSKNCRNLKGDAKDKLRSVMELVYHPQSGWVPLDTCVWQGLSYLPNSLALANIYPASAELFQRTLGVADGKIPQAIGMVRESWSSHTITYHIEVKGTVCEFEEPFHFSQNQMNLAWKYAFKHGKTPSDVFLIGRVYNVEKEKPGLKFYWNPWEMINKGSLVMTVSDGYRIAPGNAAVTSKAA